MQNKTKKVNLFGNFALNTFWGFILRIIFEFLYVLDEQSDPSNPDPSLLKKV
jgi:hypothetical protein